MRSELPGLRSPYPLATLMPAFMQEGPGLVAITEGLDEVLAPAVAVLDCLEAYLDVRLAPLDFLGWLATWVGASLDDRWDEHQQRDHLLASVSLNRSRGAVESLRAEVAQQSGGDVEIRNPGATTWNTSPTGSLPRSGPALVVRVRVDDPSSVRHEALEAVIAAAKPAHVPHVLEVVRR